ncbi:MULTISPECIES: MarR family winged helix-turn-helix transcriptional regulator [unclassified Nocardioides]|uniref:MarR family winged helix-turn-helix transcriptional regulator n=1 Tax=unclassified Nocardioides TaxID=2615069 RepID=UPI0009F028F4|nr:MULTISPECIES: MarR family transcriptional regulator [unclassified Nocardioides]GAW49999.1 Regulatory protein MarR [Nocardioides sp. PD653-B2]GAW55908.1 Regulatory protein MarR [Nocardioides sp. PD653]
MSDAPTPESVALALQESLSLLVRRLRQVRVPGSLSQPESQALAKLVREEPMTSADLARAENISAQSMGAIVAALESQQLVERHRDPGDGRRMLLVPTAAGRRRAEDKRTARGEQIARALTSDFSDDDLARLLQAAPLLERLARTLS